MKKKMLLVLGFLVLTGGMAFAQFNTITVDVGPTIGGLLLGQAANIIGEDGLDASGFGIGAQYERNISRALSVAARFAYMGASMTVDMEERGERAVTDLDLSSFSVEGHVRFYPLGDTFFVGGLVGYGNLSASFDGDLVAEDNYGNASKVYVSTSPSRSYLKIGARVGWRISFGNNGGFTFEPSFGYSYGFGLGDSFDKQLSDKVGKDVIGIDTAFRIIENMMFIGGPKMSLAFGWRF